MRAAQDLDIDFHIAGNWSYSSDEEREADERQNGIKIHQIDFIRTPYHPGNKKAYVQLKDLVEKEGFDIIHCNTPIGGVLGRLVGRKCNVPKIIYQAHGFHFFKGAPKLNWMIYYPIEKWLARYTDVIITINREDYERAKEKLKPRNNGRFYSVSGVGIDTAQYDAKKTHRNQKRAELGLKDGDIALISMGDLIERKNYATAIRAVALASKKDLHYYICGKGPNEDKLKSLSEELGVSDHIHFLGFRSDIKDLLAASDIFLFTTLQEGLPRSMMEAMASGLPCIASKIRGNTDLLEGSNGGFLCDPTNAAEFAEKIDLLAQDPALREVIGENSLITIKNFNIDTVIDEFRAIYEFESKDKFQER